MSELPRRTETPLPWSDSKHLFRVAVDSLPNGVMVVRRDATIAVVNHQIERQFGYGREELIGQSVELLLADAWRIAQARDPQESLVAPQDRRTGEGRELYGRRRDGSEFPVDISLHPVETEDGRCVLASVVDISRQVDAENTIKAALNRQLGFERLAAEMSFKFINLPPDQVLDAIRDTLQRLGEAFEVDRCSFYRIRGNAPLTAIGLWHRPGVEPPPTVSGSLERFPWGQETIRSGRLLCFANVEEIPNEVDRANYQSYGVRSAVTVPLSVAGRVVGAIGFNMTDSERVWEPDTIHSMRVIAAVFANVLARSEGDEALLQAIAQAEHHRNQLKAENLYLRREVRERIGTRTIVGQSPAIRRVLEQIAQVAPTDSTVLLLGETGTGKELLAAHVHELSVRRERMMVRVNCAAIPVTLMESELFGREKGAFTGALARQIGRFELANQSTIFLDEIGDLPPDIQVKLLRVLEERQIERLGSPKTIHIDVRIIVATHRDLEQKVGDETFREDLFFRLNVFPIVVPPLRERIDDIPLLVWRFVAEFSMAFGKRIDTISREDMDALQRYAWPGNIRELRNVVERAMIVATGPQLTIGPPMPATPAASRSLKLTDVEREHIRSVLESTEWRIRGASGAADRLGLRPTTLETRMAKLGIVRPRQ
jgi:formate hydrogenlyase transcriptional activator